jgi:hypothetical protein
VDFSKHKLDKIVAGGKGKKKYPARQYKVCAAHKKRSETTCSCKFYIVLLHKGCYFEKYHSIRNYETLYAVSSGLSSGVSSVQSNCKEEYIPGLNM